MNATLAPSAAPPHHLKIWSDGTRIFVEIPGVPGKDAYITTYTFDTRGIALTLSLLGLNRVDYDYHGSTPIPASYNTDAIGTPEQRALAEATLIKMGILQPHQRSRK